MTTSPAIELYRKMYVDMQFERTALFALLKEHHPANSVLYPGCFVHIAPSFVFPNVVYVDRSPEAFHFFADSAAIQEYINRHKIYKRSAYYRFIFQDYTQLLPLREESFDLLLSLFAGNVLLPCKQYLKPGGILLTNHSQGNAAKAAADPDLQLLAAVQYREKNYKLITTNPESILKARFKTGRYLKETSCGVQYAEEENYFLFEKKRSSRHFN
jgi:hypothetical protein